MARLRSRALPGAVALVRAASFLPFLVAALILLAAAERWGGSRAEGAARALLEVLADEEDARPVLLFAFHAADCPGYGTLLEHWEALERSGEARVVGVMLGARRGALDSEPLEVGFPVRPELARATERLVVGLGFRRTPVSVLLDPRGRVRLALATTAEAAAQAEAARRMREHADWLGREAS